MDELHKQPVARTPFFLLREFLSAGKKFSTRECIQTKEGGFPPFKIRNGKNEPLPCRMCGCGRESKWDLKEIVN